MSGMPGKEAAIGRELSAALQASGVPAAAIRLDCDILRFHTITVELVKWIRQSLLLFRLHAASLKSTAVAELRQNHGRTKHE